MLSKFLTMMVLAIAATGVAWAQVDINRADQAALESIKGSNFKDWNDLEKRVKGVGPASAKRLLQGGLTVNGKPRPDAKMEAVAHQPRSTLAK